VGEDREKLEDVAKKFGKESKDVPVVVPIEFENGPKDYGVNPKVETTIIIANKGKVEANIALGKDGLTDKAIEKILGEVDSKLLK
jgi:cytochrome oxidase Cu insertion factor (SCO1/SenC/PrrC family)